MSDYVLSVILGIVEGLTEFIPVSSTAHLRIAEALLHLHYSQLSLGSGYWKMYSIVIQLGAILTLPIYFRHRIAKFFSTFPRGERGERTIVTHPLSLVMIAFVVTAIPSFLLVKVIGKHLESPYVIGTALLVGGIVMWFIDARNSKAEEAGEAATGGVIHTWHMEEMSLLQAAVDRGVPDIVGGVSGDVAVDVHDRGGAGGGDVASERAGVFVFPVDSDDGDGDGVHAVEVAAREGWKPDRGCEH